MLGPDKLGDFLAWSWDATSGPKPPDQGSTAKHGQDRCLRRPASNRRGATPVEQHFVVFRGKIYNEQPVWLTATEDSWTRYLRKLSILQSQIPPIMVVFLRGGTIALGGIVGSVVRRNEELSGWAPAAYRRPEAPICQNGR